jgi:hypothetical protein
MDSRHKSNFTFRNDDLDALRKITADRPGSTMTGNLRAALELLVAVGRLDPTADVTTLDKYFPGNNDGQVPPHWRTMLREHRCTGFILDGHALDHLEAAMYVLRQAFGPDGKAVKLAMAANRQVLDLGYDRIRALLTVIKHSGGRISLMATESAAVEIMEQTIDLMQHHNIGLFTAHTAAHASTARGWTVITTSRNMATYTRLGVPALEIPHD